MFSRREVLRGLGATVALPWLEVMAPKSSPLRLVCIEQAHGAAGSSPYGIQNNLWSPALTGRNFVLTAMGAKPLEALRDHITLNSNTGVPSAAPTEAGAIGGAHDRSSATNLSQTHPKHTEGSDIECGISLDQLHSQRFGQDTPLPSM